MDSYIIRIYRRDSNNQPLAGTIEVVGSNSKSLQSHPFNDREKLWELLALPHKPDNSGLKNKSEQTGISN